MSTSAVDERNRYRRAYVPSTALAQEVELAEEMMQVLLTDGRIISVPLIWFPVLRAATRPTTARGAPSGRLQQTGALRAPSGGVRYPPARCGSVLPSRFSFHDKRHPSVRQRDLASSLTAPMPPRWSACGHPGVAGW